MHADEYQKFTKTTAKYPAENALQYLALGLCGESGEVAEKVKKLMRDKDIFTIENMSIEDKENIMKEAGDLLWYCARLCDELDYDLSYVMRVNADKLYSRLDRNKLHGSGDNR